MKTIKTCLAIGLVMALMLCAMPIGLVAAAEDLAYTYTPNGNSGAVITVTAGSVNSVTVDNPALANVTQNGDTITVTGVTDAVGVATLSVDDGSGTSRSIAVPIGYTTFLFDGDTLTVVPGQDDKYEVTGINPQDEEYTVGDDTYPLPVTQSAEGYDVYQNAENYKLCVNIKKSGGIYAFSGTSDDMAIAVKKEATTPATLLLAGLDLTSSFTAPITVKKESTSTVTVTSLAGHTNTLTDAAFNNADLYGDPLEDGGDGTNVEYAESAVIKGKSYANITLNGTGNLILNGHCKNGIKVGEYGYLTIKETALTINSAGNGLSCDNVLQIDSGKIAITADTGDGIRTDPDVVDETMGCAGNILINGGDITILAGGDAVQSAQGITIAGGHINANVAGDGIDANADIALTGGTLQIQAGADSVPLDADGTLTINGATVLAAGSDPTMTLPSNTSQPYITFAGNVASGKTINITYNDKTTWNTKAGKDANFVLYSSPDMTSASGWNIVINDAALLDGPVEDPCVNGHSWDSGTWNNEPTCTEGGQKLYTCLECDETKTEDVGPYDHEYVNGYCLYGSEEDPDAVWYTVTFAGEHSTVTTYLTQDTTTSHETDAKTALARNSDTGLKDITGDGQVNFMVTADAGYEIVGVEVTAGTENYKNLKAIDEAAGLYRITKITGDLTLTVTTQVAETTDVLYGDTNLNGDVTAEDALLALQATTGKVTLTEQQILASDVDTVTGVTANDALAILQYATKKITSFPVEEAAAAHAIA